MNKNRFTLLELLVAMAVFSVMMTVLMQFFTSSQKITLRTKNKTESYSDARLIMDMITKDLKTIKYEGPSPSDASEPLTFEGNTLKFHAKSPYADKSGEKVYVQYDGTGTNQLAYQNGSGTSQLLSDKVVRFTVTGDKSSTDEKPHFPNNVTVELMVGEEQNTNTFVKSIYIGGRGQ